jgi:Tol biopolymer transport system component
MSRLSSFDRSMLSLIVGLMGLIALTVKLGDRVGVQVVRVSPLGEAHSTDMIRLEFTESLSRESLTPRFQITPAVDGEFRWRGSTVLFDPDESLVPGQSYTVRIEQGAETDSGRTLLDTYEFSFEVRQPEVAYLAPADGFPQNIWIARPNDPDSVRQVTFSASGVFDFAVRPDGRAIAFSERRSDRPATDLKMIDLDTGEVSWLLDCSDSDCASPVWRPDGGMLAYTRVDMNTLLPNVGVSPYRVWLLDLTTTPASTYPLFEDTQVLGYGPQWSGNGERISLFDNSLPGVVVFDMLTDALNMIESDHGTSGALSPDGTLLVFPEVIFDEGRAWSRLNVANLEERTLETLLPPDEPVDDSFASWRPQGDMLLVGRRYRDERFTNTTQLYLVDPADGTSTPLVEDPRYNHGFVEWNPTGDAVLVQRFQQFDENGQPNRGGRPEIWQVDAATGDLTQVAVNGMFPRWVP